MKLVKSSYDKKITGVCGGLASYFNVNPTIVRIAFVIGSLVSLGAAFIIYVALAVIMPDGY